MESEVVLRVADLARGGAGVAKDETGRVVFIPFTAPGDLVRAIIIKTHKKYAEAELVEVLEPSSHRRTPPCAVFGRCGGCQWQHVDYDLQWETKVKGVLQVLKREGILVPDVCDQLPAAQIWEYRNRIQLRGQGPELGFYKGQTRDLVPANRCEIARPELNQAWNEVRQEGEKLRRPFKVEVELTSAGKVNFFWDAPHSAGGFRQVHDEQNQRMKDWIVKALENSPEGPIYDLFGGSGNLSIPLAAAFPGRDVHCVDISAPLQTRLPQLSQLLQSREEGLPQNLTFHRAPVLPWLLKQVSATKRPQAYRSHPAKASIMPPILSPNLSPKLSKIHRSEVFIKPSTAILDPPREGLGAAFLETAQALEILRVTHVISVGCDADSWAKDVSRWVQRGWSLQKMAVIDFFPQTYHVESIAYLTKP